MAEINRKGLYRPPMAEQTPEAIARRETPEIVERDGGHFIISGIIEMPATPTEVYFWQRLRDLEQLLEEPMLTEYASSVGNRSDDVGSDMREFAKHLKATASRADEIRRERRAEDIIEVRIECGLDPQTGLDEAVTVDV